MADRPCNPSHVEIHGMPHDASLFHVAVIYQVIFRIYQLYSIVVT